MLQKNIFLNGLKNAELDQDLEFDQTKKGLYLMAPEKVHKLIFPSTDFYHRWCKAVAHVDVGVQSCIDLNTCRLVKCCIVESYA